jgi:hypothetical protein
MPIAQSIVHTDGRGRASTHDRSYINYMSDSDIARRHSDCEMQCSESTQFVTVATALSCTEVSGRYFSQVECRGVKYFFDLQLSLGEPLLV